MTTIDKPVIIMDMHNTDTTTAAEDLKEALDDLGLCRADGHGFGDAPIVDITALLKAALAKIEA